MKPHTWKDGLYIEMGPTGHHQWNLTFPIGFLWLWPFFRAPDVTVMVIGLSLVVRLGMCIGVCLLVAVVVSFESSRAHGGRNGSVGWDVLPVNKEWWKTGHEKVMEVWTMETDVRITETEMWLSMHTVCIHIRWPTKAALVSNLEYCV